LSAKRLLTLPFQLAWTILVVAVPLLGVWLASTLAVYFNGPVWLAILIGVAFFPVIPLVWDAWANVRRRRKASQAKLPKRRLSDGNRILLRVLVLNGALIAGLFAFYPAGSFEALSTRGDWIIEGWSHPASGHVRRGLFAAADKVEWLYVAAKERSPFEEEEASDVVPTPAPRGDDELARAIAKTRSATTSAAARTSTAVASGTAVATGESTGDDTSEATTGDDDGTAAAVAKEIVPSADDKSSETPGAAAEVTGREPVPSAKRPEVRRDLWPMQGRLHPLVAAVPKDVETSYESVAKWIAERERDPYHRVKAIHDYIADRVRYDAATMRAKSRKYRKSQDPKTVFETGLAVCDGYSQLFNAMYRSIGGQAEYIGGESRDAEGNVSGSGHAWNAVVVDGFWFLIDVTWDAGHLEGDSFVKAYSTDYLLTPPKLFAVTHLPSHDKWQLLDEPITRGEFMRAPILRPSFFSQGLRLVSPERSQVTVSEPRFEVVLDNPGRFYLIGTVAVSGSSRSEKCTVRYVRQRARIRCDLPAAGTYVVRMFGSKVAYDSYPMVGAFQVQADI